MRYSLETAHKHTRAATPAPKGPTAMSQTRTLLTACAFTAGNGHPQRDKFLGATGRQYAGAWPTDFA